MVLDMAAAERELGYRPVTTYEESLPETVGWLVEAIGARDWRSCSPWWRGCRTSTATGSTTRPRTPGWPGTGAEAARGPARRGPAAPHGAITARTLPSPRRPPPGVRYAGQRRAATGGAATALGEAQVDMSEHDDPDARPGAAPADPAGQAPDGHALYERLIALLDEQGAIRVVEHEPQGATEAVSELRGNSLEQAAKCIVVMVKVGKKVTRYVLAVVPGDRRVDLGAVKALLDGTYVSFASRDVAERLAGSVSGTVLPFSFDERLELVVDPGLLAHEEIFFNAARLDRSLALSVKDYVRVASRAPRPSRAEAGREPAGAPRGPASAARAARGWGAGCTSHRAGPVFPGQQVGVHPLVDAGVDQAGDTVRTGVLLGDQAGALEPLVQLDGAARTGWRRHAWTARSVPRAGPCRCGRPPGSAAWTARWRRAGSSRRWPRS